MYRIRGDNVAVTHRISMGVINVLMVLWIQK